MNDTDKVKAPKGWEFVQWKKRGVFHLRRSDKKGINPLCNIRLADAPVSSEKNPMYQDICDDCLSYVEGEVTFEKVGEGMKGTDRVKALPGNAFVRGLRLDGKVHLEANKSGLALCGIEMLDMKELDSDPRLERICQHCRRVYQKVYDRDLEKVSEPKKPVETKQPVEQKPAVVEKESDEVYAPSGYVFMDNQKSRKERKGKTPKIHLQPGAEPSAICGLETKNMKPIGFNPQCRWICGNCRSKYEGEFGKLERPVEKQVKKPVEKKTERRVLKVKVVERDENTVKIKVVEQSHLWDSFTPEGKDHFEHKCVRLRSYEHPGFSGNRFDVRGSSEGGDESEVCIPNEIWPELREAIIEYNRKYGVCEACIDESRAVKVRELKRLGDEGVSGISATKVRDAIKANDFAQTKSLMVNLDQKTFEKMKKAIK